MRKFTTTDLLTIIKNTVKFIFAVFLCSGCLPLRTHKSNPTSALSESNYFPALVRFMNEFRDTLNDNGYTTYAKSVDGYLKGSFGSGFIYVAPDGKNYVITNRHVVSQAESASVEFEDPVSGKQVTYEHLSVLATDDDIDVAILAFPVGQEPFKNGLTLSTQTVNDGDEVWSAGFPGLENEPLWQLGKGTVTNSNARVNGLLDAGISGLIQHSAPVDAGNSGGPLMIKSASAPGGYTVIGINTWKATYRESTNYSIPAQVVLNFINRTANEKISVSDEELVRDRAEKFTTLFGDEQADFTSIVKYVSYDLTSKTGKDSFESVIRYAPTNERNTIITEFSYDPFEGLRYAAAYAVWQQYRPDRTVKNIYAPGTITKNGDAYSVDVTTPGAEEAVSTTWIHEQGLWRLTDNSVPDSGGKKQAKKQVKKNGSRLNNGSSVHKPSVAAPCLFYLQTGGIFPFDSSGEKYLYSSVPAAYEPKIALNVQANFIFGTRGFWGLGLFGNFENSRLGNNTMIGMDAAFHVPVNFSSFTIMPYIETGLGINWTGTDRNGVVIFYEGGIAGFKDMGAVKPGAGISVNYQLLGIGLDSYKKIGLNAFVLIAF